jgi:hypothetical protein
LECERWIDEGVLERDDDPLISCASAGEKVKRQKAEGKRQKAKGKRQKKKAKEKGKGKRRGTNEVQEVRSEIRLIEFPSDLVPPMWPFVTPGRVAKAGLSTSRCRVLRSKMASAAMNRLLFTCEQCPVQGML